MWNKLGVLAGVISALVALAALFYNLFPDSIKPPVIKRPYIGLETDIRSPDIMNRNNIANKNNRIEEIKVVDISPIKDDYFHLMLKMQITYFYDKRHQKSGNKPARVRVIFAHDGGGILKFKQVDANWGRASYQSWGNDQVKAFEPVSIKIRLEAAEFKSEQFFVSLYEHGKSGRNFFHNVLFYREYTWMRSL